VVVAEDLAAAVSEARLEALVEEVLTVVLAGAVVAVAGDSAAAVAATRY
jgi:hypothetical protein